MKGWGLQPKECPLSAIIAAATITGCIEYGSAGAQIKPLIGHIMANPIRFDTPILNVPGALNYWQPNTERQQRAFQQVIARIKQSA